ncbi:MAG: hypothetical protein QOJ07_2343 [Thermoleophilaceae bacterium]|jgi:hypothetical protein|nr:hypothetical protein [Thermoleophilaceae bacterium]
MADDLTPEDAEVEAVADGEIESGTAIEPVDGPPTELIVAETPGELVPYVAKPSAVSAGVQRRFSAAYAVVLGIFVLGALGTVMALTGFRPGAPTKWSSFRPSGDRLQKAQAIADFVAPGYKLDDQKQMVVVQARDAGVGTQQIQFVAVPGQAQYDIIDGANTVAYEMCGLGEHCSISTGTPSTDRDRLLRREALEIALYTFKYVGSTDAVVVFMPPPAGATTSWALLFKKQNYGVELDHSITKTLPEPAPTPATLAASPERDLVEQLTGNARYSYKIQDVNGAPVLVLDAPST